MSEEKENKGEWNVKIEEAAQDIGQAAQGYKHMHIWQAQKATTRHKYLMGSGICIGPLASVIQSIALALKMENDNMFSVFVILLGFLSGILVATVKFGKYDEVSNANKSAAARYTSIEANVRRQLGLYRRDRMPAIAYMDWLETKYEELLMSAPLISASIFERYSDYAKSKGFPVPDQYDHLITINKEYAATQVPDQSSIQVVISKDKEGEKEEDSDVNMKPLHRSISTIRSYAVMAKIPEINCASDKILEYEMNRLMSIR
jgi:hypothetical protein